MPISSGLSDTQNCECEGVKTIRHIVVYRLRTRFVEELEKLHAAESDGVDWLKELEILL